MFVELYKPKFNIEPGLKGNITISEMWPANEVINSDCIETISIEGEQFNSGITNGIYHRVVISGKKYDAVGYIANKDYERLVH